MNQPCTRNVQFQDETDGTSSAELLNPCSAALPICKHTSTAELTVFRVQSRRNHRKELTMFLPKSDVFKDLRQEAIHEISEFAVEESYNAGDVIFSAGQPADYFFILVHGTVGLNVGPGASAHYTVNRIGETFGWSSMVGRDSYSSEAECVVPTTVMKIHKNDLETVFDNHARSGRVFYKRLAGALGERWLDTHQSYMSSMAQREAV
jgi:CRP-like cAMP-binding protein